MDSNVGRRKLPRKLISVPGQIRIGRSSPHEVVITDLSEGGCCVIEKGGWIKQGSFVSIRVGGIGPIEATVRWAVDGEMGLEFQRPIYGPLFEHIQAILAQSNDTAERHTMMR